METRKQMEQWLRDQGFEMVDRSWELSSHPVHVRVWFNDDQHITITVGRLSEEDWACLSFDLSETQIREAVVKTIEQYCMDRAHVLQVAQALRDCLDKGINHKSIGDLSKGIVGNP